MEIPTNVFTFTGESTGLFKEEPRLPTMGGDTTSSPAVHPVTEVAPIVVPNVTSNDGVILVVYRFPTPEPVTPLQWLSKAIFGTSYMLHMVDKDAVDIEMGRPIEVRCFE